MRHRYFHLDPDLLRQMLAGMDLMRLFNQLLLASAGDAEEAMAWMRYLQEQGYIDESVDLEAFFARSRVVPLVHQRTRMPLDLVVARDSLEMAFLDRAKTVDIGGLKVPMITPEDLVIAKLFANRPRDLEDVRAVLGTLGSSMDLRYVRNILGQLDEAEDRAELLPTLERMLNEPETDD